MNYNVDKEKVRFTWFKRIRSQLQCFSEKSRNYNVSNNKIPIAMFERIRSELQCLRKTSELQYLQR